MKRRFALLLAVATVALVVGLTPMAHADTSAIPAGSYTVDLPGGGTLGFSVDASGNVTVTMVPDGTTAGTPSLTDEGFSVTLTNGTVSNLVEVEVENEDGQLQVKAEQEVEDAGDHESTSSSGDVSGEDHSSGSGDVSGEQPSPEPTESVSTSGDGSGDNSGSSDASPTPTSSPTSGSDGGSGSDG